MMLGKINFADLYINLTGQSFANLAAAKAAGAATINYGLFINTIINFLIIALVLFFMIKAINKISKPAPAPGCARDQGMPLLPDQGPEEGHPLPGLHLRTEVDSFSRLHFIIAAPNCRYFNCTLFSIFCLARRSRVV